MNILRAAAEYIAVRFVGFVASFLPRREIPAVASSLAALVRIADRRHRRVAFHNLASVTHIIPKSRHSEIVKRLYQHLVTLFFEMQHIRRMRQKRFLSLLAEGSLRAVCRNLANRRPAIFITPHLGNWDLAGALLALLAPPFYAVARPLDNPFLERYISRLRKRLGLQTVPKRGAIKRLLALLRSGANVGIVADQNAPTDHIFIPFLGKNAATTKTPALLAAKTRSPIIPVCLVREKVLRYRLLLGKSISPEEGCSQDRDVARMTLAFTRQFEMWVRAFPHQWLWTHRRWKTRPEGESVG